MKTGRAFSAFCGSLIDLLSLWVEIYYQALQSFTVYHQIGKANTVNGFYPHVFKISTFVDYYGYKHIFLKIYLQELSTAAEHSLV